MINTLFYTRYLIGIKKKLQILKYHVPFTVLSYYGVEYARVKYILVRETRTARRRNVRSRMKYIFTD